MIETRNLCVIGTLVLAFMLIGLASCREKDRRPNRYLIPDGYVGWVRINYKIKDAPEIPLEGGYNLFQFPQTGIINTSSYGETGFAQDEYYYYSDSDRRKIQDTGDNKVIWGETGYGSTMIPGKEPTRYAVFFVGTKEEYEKYGIENEDADHDPIIGPIDKLRFDKRSNTDEAPSPNTNIRRP